MSGRATEQDVEEDFNPMSCWAWKPTVLERKDIYITLDDYQRNTINYAIS